MRYAREVMDLMAPFPGRSWRIAEIVNHVARGRPASKQQRERYRKGVRRVLESLIEMGCVEREPAQNGGTTRYRWRHAPIGATGVSAPIGATGVALVCAADTPPG